MALKKAKRRPLPEMGLNITSLLDVLTVMIFFLIRTLTVSNQAFEVPEQLRLPAAITDSQAQEATVVALSRKDIRVNHDIILQLDKNHKFPSAEVAEDGRTLAKLKTRLEKERNKKKQLFLSKGGSEFIPPGKILIQADKDLPFETVKYMLYTVASSGYTDFQFVVENKEGQ